MSDESSKPKKVYAERVYPATKPEHIGFPPMPESFLHEPQEYLAVPLPEGATLEEKQEAYYKEVRAYARDLLCGAARNAILTLPMHEAAALIKDVMAEALQEAQLSVPGAAIAAGHSEATQKRIRALEPAPSNSILTTLMCALSEQENRGHSLEELAFAVMRRHPEVSMFRLREILPRYCEKKLLDFRGGRYYKKYLNALEYASVQRLRDAIPSVFAIMEGVMTLDSDSHVGHVRFMGTAEHLAELRRSVLEAAQKWARQHSGGEPDGSEQSCHMIVLSGPIAASKRAGKKNRS